MLELYIEGCELYNDATNEFIYVQPTKLQLEHSLISIRKWEAKTHKPFLKDENKTTDEIREYIKCMTINPVKNPDIYKYLSVSDIQKVITYIQDPMTATWFSDNAKHLGKKIGFGEIVTAEIIYYWMCTMNIPLECEKWHLNQLLTLVRVISEKNKDPKVDKKQAARNRAMLNAQRKAKYHTRG